jgi:hypothetical protein
MDLLGKDTYATDTVRANRIGILMALAKKSLYAMSFRGHLEWRMHAFKKLSAIVWVDKKTGPCDVHGGPNNPWGRGRMSGG